MDGGIRRGTDIVKALCLGARAVLCGRAYAYGLAAAGEAGVARALEILRADVERTLPYVASVINLGLNEVAARLNAVSPLLAQKLLDATYRPGKDYGVTPAMGENLR
jgi:hypothetical protein